MEQVAQQAPLQEVLKGQDQAVAAATTKDGLTTVVVSFYVNAWDHALNCYIWSEDHVEYIPSDIHVTLASHYEDGLANELLSQYGLDVNAHIWE